MDWTKIKPKHFLHNNLRLTELGALAKLLCLTALLERVPTPCEMSAEVPQPTCRGLAEGLQRQCTSLEDILAKVLEDVDDINHKRNVSKDTSRRYREKLKHKNNDGDTSLSTSRDTTEKRREDKIREDSKKCHPKTDTIINLYNSATNSKCKLVDSNREPISARLNEGYTVEECKTVITKKNEEWKNTDMNKYLTIQTLFAKSKFDKYLNQKTKKEEPTRML